ncbi:MAG: preprotein translocase subunit SecG [Alphaproteobacteria bacterium]
MDQVLLVIHLLVAIALVATVLLQRSEGGALGIGGGGGGGGMMSARGAANALTKATAWLAAAFFLTSIGLTILARQNVNEPSLLDTINEVDSETGISLPVARDTDAATEDDGAPQIPVTDQ